jgi:hypothetical protein
MTITDPFADAPAEPLSTDIGDPPPNGAAQAVDPSKAPAPPSEGKVVVTLKGGRDFDAPWIVIHAADVADANAQLNSDLAALMGRVQNAAATFRGAAGPSASPAAATPQRQAPQGATEAPSWAGQAPDGYKYATGVKNGRTWHAWFPIERDGGEKIWLNPPK